MLKGHVMDTSIAGVNEEPIFAEVPRSSIVTSSSSRANAMPNIHTIEKV